MEFTIKQESELSFKAYDESNNLIGSCSYVTDKDSFYNSIEDSWNDRPTTDLYEWLLKSMNNKYGYGFKVRFTSEGYAHDEVQYAKQKGGVVNPNNVPIPEDSYLYPITWEWDGNCGWNIYWRKYNFDTTANKDALIGHVSIDKKMFAINIDWLEFGEIIFDPNENGNKFDSVRLFQLVSDCMKDCALHKEKYNKHYEEPVDWYELNDKGYFDEN